MATTAQQFNPHEQSPSLPTVMAYCEHTWLHHTWDGARVWNWWDGRPLHCWRDAHLGGLEMGLALWQFPPHLMEVWEQAMKLERMWQSHAR